MIKRLLVAVGVIALFASCAFADGGGLQLRNLPGVIDCGISPADVCGYTNDLVLRLAQTQPPPGYIAPSPGPAIGGQIGSPTYVVPAPKPQSSIIDIGQALGPFLQPYVNALVGMLLTALVTWLAQRISKIIGVKLDEGARAALTTALQNQAGSLIADGFAHFDGVKIVTNDTKVAESANEIMAVIPDAAKRLGFTPDYVAKRIVDTIPQIAAGAAMIAAAPANANPAPAKAA